MQAARAAAEKKAVDITVLDVRKGSDVTDYMVLAGAESSTQMRAIFEGVVATLQELGLHPLRQDGHSSDRWIALDYGGLVMHVMLPEARGFYRLEHLWDGSRRVAWEENHKAKGKRKKE